MGEKSEFGDLAWLFANNNLNRGILRQNFDEAALLWRAVRTSRGPILEIGRRHGGSTVLLLQAANGRTVTSVDLAPQHHPLCDSFFEKTKADEPDRLNLVIGNSRAARAGEVFGFLFIDGDHSYEGVKADVCAHWRSLRAFDGAPAGVVFHDAVPNDGLAHVGKLNHHEGVSRVCDELVALGCAERVDSAGSSLWLYKIAEIPEAYLRSEAEPSIVLETSEVSAYAHLKRREDIALLLPENAVGIELGIAEGVLSERLLKHENIGFLYGVDMYAGDRGHDVEQYKRALRRMAPFQGRYSLLHMRFDQALDLFADESLDFIYVDGYAHTGEEGGATFHDWWPKLKPGGLIAGDDYALAWPDVIANVDNFLKKYELKGYVIPFVEKDTLYCKYPTWFAWKPAEN